MIRKILAPLDGSELAEAVLPYVAETAARTGAEVVLLTSIQPIGVWEATAAVLNLSQEEELALQYLDGQVGRLRAQGISTRSRVVHGDAAAAILDAAADEAADLVAMSSHGRSGITRWLFGSVTDRVLHNTDIPLLIVRPPAKGQPAPSPEFKKILVPLDSSPVAEAILPFVEAVAKAFGSSLALYHAVPPLLAYPGFEPVQPAYTGNLLEEMQKQAREFLTRVGKDMESRGFEVALLTSVDLAVDGILSAAEEVGADLIAVSTHGRSGIGRAVIGSVADAVVRRATLPCLLVNPTRARPRK